MAITLSLEDLLKDEVAVGVKGDHPIILISIKSVLQKKN
jgi:hypothetical protein